jgi:nucleotide-binding universal stress UspA family protein
VGTIVVGVDGSESSERALDFALREAQLRKARLRVVRAATLWGELVTGADAPVPWPSAGGETREAVERGADQDLARWVEAARNRTRVHDVAAEMVTRKGDAPAVLRAAAGDAELLVVGHRRRGDPSRLLLESVSRELSRDPICPIVVVPDRDTVQESAS